MIHGIGIDLIEIDRIKDVYIKFLAGRFATKEAFSKALGTGLGKTVAFNDIDCYNDEKGKPCIEYPGFIVHVSITHTQHYAMSEVILEK